MCTLIDMNGEGDDAHDKTLLPGVRGREAMRRWPGVDGGGGARWTRIVEPGVLGKPGVLGACGVRGGRPLLGATSAPGVCGGSRSLGWVCNSGVVERDMVGSAGGYGGEGEGESESEKKLCWMEVYMPWWDLRWK